MTPGEIDLKVRQLIAEAIGKTPTEVLNNDYVLTHKQANDLYCVAMNLAFNVLPNKILNDETALVDLLKRTHAHWLATGVHPGAYQ